MHTTRDHRRQYALLAVVAVFAAAVFCVDLFTPPEVDVWVFYLPVILAPVLINNTRQILFAALACSVLVVIGFYVSPLGLPLWSDIWNRGMDLLALWMTAFAGVMITRRSVQLATAMEGLRCESIEHDLAKQALAKSEERMRLAVEGAHMGTWDIDLQTGTRHLVRHPVSHVRLSADPRRRSHPGNVGSLRPSRRPGLCAQESRTGTPGTLAVAQRVSHYSRRRRPAGLAGRLRPISRQRSGRRRALRRRRFRHYAPQKTGARSAGNRRTRTMAHRPGTARQHRPGTYRAWD